MARIICSIIPHDVGVEARFSFGRDVLGWGQSETTGETVHKEVVVRKFAPARNRILAFDEQALDTRDTETNSEMMK